MSEVNPIREVQEVPGERWVYEVHSRSRPGHKHRVDLEGYQWNGDCDCEDFKFNREPDVRRGAERHDDFRCYHIKAARSYVMEEVFPLLAAHMPGGAKAKPAREELPPVERCKAFISKLENLGTLMAIDRVLQSKISELYEKQNTDQSGEPERASPKIYNLEDRRYTR